MKYKAVIFDLDGTLLDTLQDLADSVNEALGHLGFPKHGVEAYKNFVEHRYDGAGFPRRTQRNQNPQLACLRLLWLKEGVLSDTFASVTCHL